MITNFQVKIKNKIFIQAKLNMYKIKVKIKRFHQRLSQMKIHKRLKNYSLINH